jgi:hypothetical protein
VSLDPIIRAAIEDSVVKEEQSKTLANRLISWYSALLMGNERLDERDTVDRRLEMLYDAVKVVPNGDDDNGGNR